MKNKIKFVYFDVGGVLLRWRETLLELAKVYRKPIGDVEKAYLKYEELSLRGKIDTKLLWRKFCGDLKIKADDKFNFVEFSMENFLPIKQTHKLLKQLIGHIPVGLLTNVHPGFFERAIFHKHIPDLKYHAVVQSCEIGLIKPEKGIYLHAGRLAQAPHKNILFIDDLEVNVVAARSLGWKTVLFETDNPGKSIKEIKNILGI